MVGSVLISSTARRLALAAFGGAAAVVLLPDVLRLDGRLPMIATVAWRPQAVAGAALTASALVTWRPTRPAGAVLCAVAAAGAVAVARRTGTERAAVATGEPLTVLSANVFTGRADTGLLAELIERVEPDFVVLPEAGCDFRDKLLPLVAHLGYSGWAATPPGMADILGVVLLAGPRAGQIQVEAGRDLRYRHLEATGGLLGSRTLFAVHTAAPRTPRLAARWRRELGVVGRWARTTPAPVVAGDLNATLDHAPLRAALGGCVPAARGLRALLGTYPSRLPRWFGIRIDHVLVPAGTTVVDVSVHDVPGSDHRAVVARLVLPEVAQG
jgi:endonuclease/exonuclease/phosphatase (EEP) superfamily protein YafD